MAFSRQAAPLLTSLFMLACAPLVSAQVVAMPIYGMPAAAMGGMHSGGQGYLGVGLRSVGDPSIASFHLKETHGVVVVMVDHDGPAWKAGIREHDVILSVNGIPADNEDQLRRLLREMRPGNTAQIAISRDGTAQTLTAMMANGEELGRQAWKKHWVVPAPSDAAVEEPPIAPPSRPSGGLVHGFTSGHFLPQFGAYTGVIVNEIQPQLAEFFGLKNCKGLLVESVDSNSPAATAGLLAGDVVTRLNGNAIATRGDWNKALRDSKGHPVSMTVMRDHHEQVLVMVPDAKRRSSLEMEDKAEHPRWSGLMLAHLQVL